jgi:dTDP-4-amino-4,6-dideoxygalactose transaminase
VIDKSKIWLSSPHMSGNEMKYVQEAFDGNWIAPLGNVDGFEKDLEQFWEKVLMLRCLTQVLLRYISLL